MYHPPMTTTPPATDTDLPVSVADVRAASKIVSRAAHRTPSLRSASFDELLGGSVWFKCENLQRVGAFKFRGAYHAMSRLSDEQRERGVLAFSSGNHAQGVALAGKLLGVRTTIVMPTDAPQSKLAATRHYQAAGVRGSEVIQYERSEITREELGAQLAEERGLTIIPPYDHPDVIAGQGTCALELFEDAGVLDCLFVCCGGGGLLSGCATVAHAVTSGKCTIVGVEPDAADDAMRSFRTGELHSVRDPETIADGARTPSLGVNTFPIVRALATEMMTVTDAELIEAMELVMTRLKQVVEPSGVLGLAGLIKMSRGKWGGARGDEGEKWREAVRAKRIGVIISGGNVSPDRLATLFGAGS